MFLINYFVEHNRYLNILGIFVILGIAALFSRKRAHINYKLILNALIMHFVIAFLVLRTSVGRQVIAAVADMIKNLYLFAQDGIQFVFGSLSNQQGPWGFIFAINVLPIIIFFGALMSLLFHLGIIQRIVTVINYVVQPLLRTSGAETLCAIANSFLGQTEAPLLIRHYIKNMTKSEIMVVMVSGMGTISGAILAVYAKMGVPVGHLLSASVMAIPATILIAKILYPETEKPETIRGALIEPVEVPTSNVLDAISTGTCDGLQLALNVGAMLIAFLALIAMINAVLGYGAFFTNSFFVYMGLDWHVPALTLQYIFGIIFSPFGWLMGLNNGEIFKIGELIGIKVAINEMVAFTAMLNMQLSERATMLVTYALCGFSNFSCIGIQIGGIGVLAPSKRQVLSELGLYAVLGGTLANLLSAMVAGLLL